MPEAATLLAAAVTPPDATCAAAPPGLEEELLALKKCFRDIVALSTMPALWTGAHPTRIAESLAASLYTTLDAAFVYVAFNAAPGLAATSVAQTGRYQLDAALAEAVGDDILAWARTHDPEDLLILPARGTRPGFQVLVTGIGFEAELGVLAVSCPADRELPAWSRFVLNVAATQASTAVQNARLMGSLRESQASLMQVDRRKDEFLATLSHELRNPLAPLRNSLHVMRLRGTTDPLHPMMERQVDHLVRLVDDLLEVSRINQGTLELRRERIDVATIVRSAVETSEPLVQAGRHDLTVTLPDEPMWLEGDLVRLSQLLANILDNAARYCDTGGVIRLEARREAASVAISVKDNGIGIERETLSRIFEMFNRGDAARRAWESGLGIGLALARRIAELHGGSIAAHSEGPSKGSEFVVRLPLAQRGAPERAASPGGSAPIAATRVLVVDDNADAGDSLAVILRMLGADVRVVRDGRSALDTLATFDATAVLLDIGMPDMDGYEVARRVRADLPNCRATLVALSGWGQDEDRRRAREAGFDHHLVKPAEIATLQALLLSLEAARARSSEGAASA